DPHSETAL
nr:Chain A, Transmembrane and immunoglobulin domain-containing protein 1 [Homo sapiens]